MSPANVTAQRELDDFKALFRSVMGIELAAQNVGELVRELICCCKTRLATKLMIQAEQDDAASRRKKTNPDLAGTGDDSATMQFAIVDEKTPRDESKFDDLPPATVTPEQAKQLVDQQKLGGMFKEPPAT
jgi:hypothetical protein